MSLKAPEQGVDFVFQTVCRRSLSKIALIDDERTSESELTEYDVQEIADEINKSGRKRVDEESV